MNLLTIVPAYVWVFAAPLTITLAVIVPGWVKRPMPWVMLLILASVALMGIGFVDGDNRCPEGGYEGREKVLTITFTEETEEGTVTWEEYRTYCIKDGNITGRV